jgi:hypothetical protein
MDQTLNQQFISSSGKHTFKFIYYCEDEIIKFRGNLNVYDRLLGYSLI